MRLIKDDILDFYRRYDKVILEEGILASRKGDTAEERRLHAEYLDFTATVEILKNSQTIIFPTDVMLDLFHHIDRIDTNRSLLLPFPFTAVQFTHAISEAEIMPYIEMNDWQAADPSRKDAVEGLLLADPSQDPEWKRELVKLKDPAQREREAAIFNINFCCWFRSTSISRVAFSPISKNAQGRERERITYDNIGDLNEEQIQNKERLIKLGYAIALFLAADNVTIQKTVQDPAVQRKRIAKGKRPLSEYHTVRIEKVVLAGEVSPQGQGTAHGHMYPVRGHFRTYHYGPKGLEQPQDSRRVWVHSHFRGVNHGLISQIKQFHRVKPARSAG
jgi:hypothetical protein